MNFTNIEINNDIKTSITLILKLISIFNLISIPNPVALLNCFKLIVLFIKCSVCAHT